MRSVKAYCIVLKWFLYEILGMTQLEKMERDRDFQKKVTGRK